MASQFPLLLLGKKKQKSQKVRLKINMNWKVNRFLGYVHDDLNFPDWLTDTSMVCTSDMSKIENNGRYIFICDW